MGNDARERVKPSHSIQVGVFHSLSAADDAVAALVEAGFEAVEAPPEGPSQEVAHAVLEKRGAETVELRKT